MTSSNRKTLTIVGILALSTALAFASSTYLKTDVASTPSFTPTEDVDVKADYDGDGTLDMATWHGATSIWEITRSSDGQKVEKAWGAGYAPYYDLPVPGDYDGDGKMDLAVWRRQDGMWYVIKSSDGSILSKAWGAAIEPYKDVPVQADYDGDGKTDFAVWRRQNNTWLILKSSDGLHTSTVWGASAAPYNDIPLPKDYDNDGKADVAVGRPAPNLIYFVKSSDGSTGSTMWITPTFQGVYVPPVGASQIELFQDTNVSAGLRAQWSCTAWESDQGSAEGLPGGLQLGNCTAYQTPRPGYAIRTLPDLGAPSDQGKYWHLNEGYHRGPMSIPPDITLAQGEDLQIFRTEVNGRVIENSANKIWLQHFNNQGIAPGSADYDTKLVREFTSDRQGKVSLYHNTKNEIRNVATNQGADFANDTWPHVYLDQKFKQEIDLSQFSGMEFSAKIDVPLIHELSGWQGPYKDSSVQMVVFLRKRSNPFVGLWLVNTLYSSFPSNYQASLSGDQWGIAMYRGSVNDVGGPLIPGAAPRSVKMDVLDYVRKASLLNPAIGQPGDYYLDSIEIGNESLGYQEYRINLSDLSMKGTLTGIIGATPTPAPTPIPTQIPTPPPTPTAISQQCPIACTNHGQCCQGQRCVVPKGKFFGRCQ